MKKRRKPIKRLNDAMKRRTMIACGIIALLFVLLIGRLIYFSIFKNGIYKRQVLSQQNYSSETLPYKRGDILDRDGNTLATSQKMYTLVLEPKNILRSEEVQKATIDALHKYMKLDEDKLLKFIKRHKDSYYSVYREELSYSQIADLKYLSLQTKQRMSQGSYLMKNTNAVIRISHWQARSLALYQTVRSELEGSSSIITVLYQASMEENINI